MNKFRDFLTCLIAFIIVATLDYATGYEVSSFPLYLIPIVLTAFYFGTKKAYFAVVLSAVAWIAIDILSGHTYAFEAIRYWNASARLLIYGLVVYGLGVYLRTLEAHRRRIEDLRRLLPICPMCGKIMWKDGTWKTPAEILASVESGAHAVDCPSCDQLDENTTPAN